MTVSPRDVALEKIRSNIEKSGHHIYIVSGGALPRYAYTIGLSDRIGFELIFPGAIFFMAAAVTEILDRVADICVTSGDWRSASGLSIGDYGSFYLRNADASWTSKLMLGALDFYGVKSVAAQQIVPDEEHWTLDIPDLERPWNAVAEPVWQWICAPWQFSVPSSSTAATNLAALRGARITEAARWEEDQWELFSGPGPDIPEWEIRVASLGTMLALDKSLEAVASLKIEEALWREPQERDWHAWRCRSR